ncbi:3447_t:CDS:2, partial [Ambispora gerdemannii]
MPKSSKPLTWVDQELTNDNLPKNIKLNIELLLGEEDLKPKRKGTELPKRSMNAFFIYRKALDKELKNRGYYDLRMREKVKLAGMLWKSENREVKEICQQLASKAKNLLEQELNSTTNYFTPTSQPESSFNDYVWYLMCTNQFSEESINEKKERLRTNAKASVKLDASDSSSSMDEENFDESFNWRRMYMKLSRPISFVAKDRGVLWLDTADGIVNTHHWKTLDCDESEYGKVVFLDYVWWFDVWGNIPNVLPGIYDVIWRFKVNPNFRLQNLQFVTRVLEVFNEKLELKHGEPIETQTTHLMNSKIFELIAEGGNWVEYCLPYQITIPEERVIDSVRIPHSVEYRLYNHEDIKRGLWIDYVRLRIHKDDDEEEELEDQHRHIN